MVYAKMASAGQMVVVDLAYQAVARQVEAVEAAVDIQLEVAYKEPCNTL